MRAKQVLPTKKCSRCGGAPPPRYHARGGAAPGAGGGGAGRPEKVMRAGQPLRAGAGAHDNQRCVFGTAIPRAVPVPRRSNA